MYYRLCFYRANTIKMLPIMATKWVNLAHFLALSLYVTGTIVLPIYTVQSIYFLLKRSKKLQ